MSATLSAYIGRRFLAALLGAVAVVATLILIVSFIEILRRASNQPVGLGQMLALAGLQMPGIALAALPFVVLLATMACFARLARSSELVVTRAAGVSVWGLVAPVALLAALVGTLSFAVLNPIAAATTQRFETLGARHLSGQSSRLTVSPEGLWLRQAYAERRTVIRARESDPTATKLTGVTVFDFTAEDRLTGRIDAARAELRPDHWLLHDAIQRDLDADDDDLATTAAPRHAERLEMPTALTSAQILDSFAPPNSISFWNLPRFIATLEASGFSAHRHVVHWHAELASPLLFCAMALIGAAFSMRHARFGGLGSMAFAAVLTGFGFYFVSDVSRALGASGAIPALLGAWTPPFAAAFFALGLLLQLEDG